MTARVNTVFQVLDTLKADIKDVSLSEDISQELLWVAIRQQADYELLLLADPEYCLLYTSPSPRDSDSSRMPSSA